MNYSLSDLIQVLTLDSTAISNLPLSLSFSGVSTDTRSLVAGQVFFALKGESFDGHNFISLAEEKGAVATIVDHPVESNLPQLIVRDTLQAYQQWGNWWRKRFKIPVIAITGSVGKTTTKELISALLATQGNVLKTQANYNNEIGVPKTLLEINESHDYAVIEMGMRARGEIALLAEIAQPTIGLITNVGTAHIGRLGSELAIAQAKCELLEKMPKESTAILNYDNLLLMETASKVWTGKTITYGLTGGDICGELLPNNQLKVGELIFPLPLEGRHHSLNFLAGLAVTKALNIDWTGFTKGITVNLPEGRSKRYTLHSDILLLDETYNAGLESMLASLELLKETEGMRRIAVLGGMKELGDRSPEFHHRVGEKVKQLGLDYLFLLGNDCDMLSLKEGAKNTPCEQFISVNDLVDRLKTIIQSGDRLLFKASHSVGLNQVVQQLLK